MTLVDKLKNIGKVCLATAAFYVSGCNEHPIVSREEWSVPPKEAVIKTEKYELVIQDPEDCAKQMAAYAKEVRSKVEKAQEIVRAEVEKGKISIENAIIAKQLVKEAADNYNKLIILNTYLKESGARFRNLYDVDNGDLIIDRATKKQTNYPGNAIWDLSKFLDENILKNDFDKKEPQNENSLDEIYDSLDSIVETGKGAAIEPHRYIPFYGRNEILDEFANPNHEYDSGEYVLGLFAVILGIAIPFGTLGGVLYYLDEKEKKKKEEEGKKKAKKKSKKKSKPTPKPTVQIEEKDEEQVAEDQEEEEEVPKVNITDPWKVDIKKIE